MKLWATLLKVYYSLHIIRLAYSYTHVELEGRKDLGYRMRRHISVTNQTVTPTNTNSTQSSELIPHCQEYSVTGLSCLPCFDNIHIWPETKAGDVAKLRCPSLPDMTQLDGYVTRKCDANGTWYTTADYSVCITRLEEIDSKDTAQQDINRMHRVAIYIYLSGFSISSISMIIAIAIFAKFKHLRCLRNLVHSQLLTAMTIKNFLWISLVIHAFYRNIFTLPVECKVIFSLYKFFFVSQYSWMFVEGLYLFLVVVKAFMTNLLRFKHCLGVGWGFPTVFIVVWLLLTVFATEDTADDQCWTFIGKTNPPKILEITFISLLLVVNVIFMVVVVYTVVNKLKTSESRQYRKAVKATVVLIPLLGGIYIMLFHGPTKLSAIWLYSTAFLQSTQGLAVAFVYCFLNSEVRLSIVKSLRRWKDERSLPTSSGSWWSRRRQSSSTCGKRDELDTETSSSRRNSRRVSDEIGVRRASQPAMETTDVNSNKLRKPKDTKVTVVVFKDPLLEEHHM